GPEGDQHRPDHVDVEGQRLGGGRLVQFLLEDVQLHRVPARAAPGRVPAGHGPAFGVENPLPPHQIGAVDHLPHDHFLPDVGGKGLPEEGAHLVPERHFRRAVSQVHTLLHRSFTYTHVIQKVRQRSIMYIKIAHGKRVTQVYVRIFELEFHHRHNTGEAMAFEQILYEVKDRI